MSKNALIIGNSDGIGLAVTAGLLKRGWQVTGISRSGSRLKDKKYSHIIADVREPGFGEKLNAVLKKDGTVDLCMYCAGVGELLDVNDMDNEVTIIEVNLLGMVKTLSVVIPLMVSRGAGQVIGLSSVADEMLSPEAPGYHASKAGFSNYLESLALALKPKGVQITNIRFGFVDTKMAKGDMRPFMMGLDRAMKHVMHCIEHKPIRYTAPRAVIPLVKFRSWMLRLKTL
ncbi:SDR family NAD(P)-dependent oxidoreductase [bacterium]|nr:SDR family NAD(P)-dependent oxidoreductase [bacterium]